MYTGRFVSPAAAGLNKLLSLWASHVRDDVFFDEELRFRQSFVQLGAHPRSQSVVFLCLSLYRR